MQNTMRAGLAGLLMLATAATSDAGSASQTGQFEYQFSMVEVSPTPGRPANTWVQAVAGFEIRNTGSVPVRIAMVPLWPTLQIEGGVQFKIRPRGVTGLAVDSNPNVRGCLSRAEDYSVLRPGQAMTASMIFDSNLGGRDLLPAKWGRISGQLLVQSLEDKRCWIEPFTVGKVAVSVNP